MGMDIYLQAFDKDDDPCSQEHNIRNRGVYHAFNDYFYGLGEEVENGEELRVHCSQWSNSTLRAEVKKAMYEDCTYCGFYTDAEANKLVNEFIATLEPSEMAYISFRVTY